MERHTATIPVDACDVDDPNRTPRGAVKGLALSLLLWAGVAALGLAAGMLYAPAGATP